VPLLVGLHEQTLPVGLFHQLDFSSKRGRWSYFALGGVK